MTTSASWLHLEERYASRLKIGVILARAHAYQPLLYAGQDRTVTIQPVPLDEHEKTVVQYLAALAERGDPCLQGRELFLIRNLLRGRGVSFFDDFAYYPDFIVWVKGDDGQHVVFLDPKGLGRLGSRERAKVRLHREIKDIEHRVRGDNPTLHLHAYILSVTPAATIDDGVCSMNEWKQQGVYFLQEPDCLRQVLGHVLGAARAV